MGMLSLAEALLSVNGLRMFADTFLSLDWEIAQND